jgi:hypothetical protein
MNATAKCITKAIITVGKQLMKFQNTAANLFGGLHNKTQNNIKRMNVSKPKTIEAIPQ